MLPYNSSKSLVFCVNILLIFIGNFQAWGHAGHKHAVDQPKIKVPAVIARVNEKDILNHNVLKNLKSYIRHQKSGGHKVTLDQEKTEVKRLIDNEIGRELLLQHAESLGIEATPELIDKKVYKIKAGFSSQHQFEIALKKRKTNLLELKKELKTEVLVDAVIEKEIQQHVKSNIGEVKAFYENKKHLFWEEDKVRASVILRKVDSKLGSISEEKAKKELEKILSQLRKGADFAKLAKKNSQDSLSRKGGDLGFFSHKKMLAAFSDKAFSMKIGEVSTVFKTRHGFHILKVTDKKAGGYTPFDVVKKNIEKKIKKQKLKRQLEKFLHQLRKKADIKIYF